MMMMCVSVFCDDDDGVCVSVVMMMMCVCVCCDDDVCVCVRVCVL